MNATQQSAESIIKPAVWPGERLLWAGQPRHGLTFRDAGFIKSVFNLGAGMIACVILFACLRTVWSTPGHLDAELLIITVFTVPFCAYLIWRTIFAPFQSARARTRTYYGVTDKRVIIFYWYFSSNE
jgi:hypothetical protein